MTVLSRVTRYRRVIAVGWLIAALVLDGLAMIPRMPVAWLYGFSGFCWGMLVTTWIVLDSKRHPTGPS